MVRGELDILKAIVPLLLTATVLLSNSAKSDGLTAQDYAEKGLKSATFFPGLAVTPTGATAFSVVRR